MKEDQPIPFIRACVENTSVLTSFLRWLDSQRESARNSLETVSEQKDLYRLQGRAECLRKLRSDIAAMTRDKGQVEDEQQRIRRVR